MKRGAFLVGLERRINNVSFDTHNGYLSVKWSGSPIRTPENFEKWSGCDLIQGPRRYIDNAIYFWKHHLMRKGLLITNNPIETNPIEKFMSAVVFNAFEGDELPNIERSKFFLFPSEAEKKLYDDWEVRRKACLDNIHKNIEQDITSWCNSRFEPLMEAFYRDLNKLFILV